MCTNSPWCDNGGRRSQLAFHSGFLMQFFFNYSHSRKKKTPKIQHKFHKEEDYMYDLIICFKNKQTNKQTIKNTVFYPSIWENILLLCLLEFGILILKEGCKDAEAAHLLLYLRTMEIVQCIPCSISGLKVCTNYSICVQTTQIIPKKLIWPKYCCVFRFIL